MTVTTPICPVLDPCRCPLCGQPNACAMASPGQTASDPCWCTRVHFSADLLKQVPAAARQKACICADCVARSDNTAQDPAQDSAQDPSQDPRQGESA